MPAKPIFAIKPKRLVVRPGTNDNRFAKIVFAASANNKTPEAEPVGT